MKQPRPQLSLHRDRWPPPARLLTARPPALGRPALQIRQGSAARCLLEAALATALLLVAGELLSIAESSGVSPSSQLVFRLWGWHWQEGDARSGIPRSCPTSSTRCIMITPVAMSALRTGAMERHATHMRATPLPSPTRKASKAPAQQRGSQQSGAHEMQHA